MNTTTWTSEDQSTTWTFETISETSTSVSTNKATQDSRQQENATIESKDQLLQWQTASWESFKTREWIDRVVRLESTTIGSLLPTSSSDSVSGSAKLTSTQQEIAATEQNVRILLNYGSINMMRLPDANASGNDSGSGCSAWNDTDACLHVPPLSPEEIVQIVTLAILFLLSLTGNMLALIKMTRKPALLRNNIYQLMLQLIVADLFVTFFCLLGDAIHKITVNWYADDVTCKLFKLLGSFAQFLSSYIVALVAVNRALVVIKPMLSPSRMKKIMLHLIIAVWIFSLLMSVPQVIIWRKVRGPYVEEFYDCTTLGFGWSEVHEMLHACIISSFIFIIPLLIMAISFILVIRTLAKTTADQIFDSVPQAIISTAIVVPNGAKRAQFTARNSHTNTGSAARSTFYSRAKQRSQRMSLQITIWYTACWLPYIAVFIAMAILKHEEFLQSISRWCFFFGQTNSIINPIIYASFHIRKHETRRGPVSRSAVGNEHQTAATFETRELHNHAKK